MKTRTSIALAGAAVAASTAMFAVPALAASGAPSSSTHTPRFTAVTVA